MDSAFSSTGPVSTIVSYFDFNTSLVEEKATVYCCFFVKLDLKSVFNSFSAQPLFAGGPAVSLLTIGIWFSVGIVSMTQKKFTITSHQ